MVTTDSLGGGIRIGGNRNPFFAQDRGRHNHGAAHFAIDHGTVHVAFPGLAVPAGAIAAGRGTLALAASELVSHHTQQVETCGFAAAAFVAALAVTTLHRATKALALAVAIATLGVTTAMSALRAALGVTAEAGTLATALSVTTKARTLATAALSRATKFRTFTAIATATLGGTAAMSAFGAALGVTAIAGTFATALGVTTKTGTFATVAAAALSVTATVATLAASSSLHVTTRALRSAAKRLATAIRTTSLHVATALLRATATVGILRAAQQFFQQVEGHSVARHTQCTQRRNGKRRERTFESHLHVGSSLFDVPESWFRQSVSRSQQHALPAMSLVFIDDPPGEMHFPRREAGRFIWDPADPAGYSGQRVVRGCWRVVRLDKAQHSIAQRGLVKGAGQLMRLTHNAL